MYAVCSVEFVEYGAHPFLRELGAAGLVEQPRYVQTRLVALIVQGLKTGKRAHFSSAAEYLFLRESEDAVEPRVEYVRADLCHQTFHIVGNIERVLPCVALLETAPHFHRVEVVDEFAVGLLRTDEVARRVVQSFPSFGEIHQPVIILFVADALRPLRHHPRAVRELQCVRCRERIGVGVLLSAVAVGHISVFQEVGRGGLACSQRSVLAVELVFQTRLVCQFRVKITYAALIGSGDYGAQKVCANARDVAVVGQTVGEPSRVLIGLEMRADILRHVFRISQNPQLRQIPLRSPRRVGVIYVVQRLAVLHRELSDGAVVARICTIHIARQSTAEQRVIQSGVEFHLIIILRSLHLDASQIFVPRLVRLFAHLVERHFLRLCRQIGAGILH